MSGKQEGGIAVDDCNNIYVGGNHGNILVYTFDGNTISGPIDNIDLGWGNHAVYDVTYDKNYEANQIKLFTKLAKDGLILTMNDIRIIFEKEIGHEVSDDYLWDVFKRHNWSKKSPRPKNPEQDLEAQEAFKKNSRKSWMPST